MNLGDILLVFLGLGFLAYLAAFFIILIALIIYHWRSANA